MGCLMSLLLCHCCNYCFSCNVLYFIKSQIMICNFRICFPYILYTMNFLPQFPHQRGKEPELTFQLTPTDFESPSSYRGDINFAKENHLVPRQAGRACLDNIDIYFFFSTFRYAATTKVQSQACR